MSFLGRYWAYLRDNPKGYWFKRKAYGWGWIPVRWQGWAVLFTYVVVFTCLLVPYIQIQDPSDIDNIRFMLEVMAWVASFLYVCYVTGERPKWQWGIPKKKK